ncbi:MAG: hypothetical protein IJ279_03310 [Clostridia bacterium]|nr:hypothetical protein [Clostridia bacterium]
MKLLIIQADNRQYFMTKYLEENGYDCTVFNPNLPSSDNERNFDGVIFALPTVKNSRINCEYEVRLDTIIPLVKKNGFVFSAMADDLFRMTIEDAELKFYDFYEREELIILNAAATAQAVLELVLINTDVMLSDMKILVTGYGRTGEAIARILSDNNVDVTVAARKLKARAKAQSENIRAVDFKEIKNIARSFNMVINTVPEKIIGSNLLAKFSDNCIFFEVASKPYGIDIAEAGKQQKKLIIASSLPGKYVACSAGKFIAQTVINMIKEERGNE